MIVGICNFALFLTSFFFVGPDHFYSVLLPERTQLVQVDTLENETINHTFVGFDTVNNFEFSLSFSVLEGEKHKLTTPEAVKIFEEDCKCEVVSIENIEFRNFRGVKYTIAKEVESTLLGGEVYISEFKNGKSINVVSMVLYEQREHLSGTLSPILNTLVLNF